jgi:hypothetical protein
MSEQLLKGLSKNLQGGFLGSMKGMGKQKKEI